MHGVGEYTLRVATASLALAAQETEAAAETDGAARAEAPAAPAAPPGRNRGEASMIVHVFNQFVSRSQKSQEM